VIERAENVLFFEIWHQLVNIPAEALNIPVLFFRDPEHADMALRLIFRKNRGDFAADDHIVSVCNREGTSDAVVICDRYQIHSPRFGAAIELFRRVIGFLQDFPERMNRRKSRVVRMDMRI
jgi:anaerobic ribonucleoside-triphosphate reductase